jgi:hypothetical protein
MAWTSKSKAAGIKAAAMQKAEARERQILEAKLRRKAMISEAELEARRRSYLQSHERRLKELLGK